MHNMSDIFRKSADNKQRVYKKQNVEIDSAASSGGQGKYMKYVSFPWPPLEKQMPFLNVIISCKNNYLRWH